MVCKMTINTQSVIRSQILDYFQILELCLCTSASLLMNYSCSCKKNPSLLLYCPAISLKIVLTTKGRKIFDCLH